jgi:hypothetical protein
MSELAMDHNLDPAHVNDLIAVCSEQAGEHGLPLTQRTWRWQPTAFW